MRTHVDPLGTLLIHSGALTEEVLADILELQRRPMPFGSLCYVMGYLDEETVALALSRQRGLPSVVLDRSVIRLDVLEGVTRETAIRHRFLPVFEDGQRIFVAAEDPLAVADAVRELRFVRGKAVVVHGALHVTLARAIRECYAARARGDLLYAGPLADVRSVGDRGFMAVVSDIAPITTHEVRALPVPESMVEKDLTELSGVELIGVQGDDSDEATGVMSVEELEAQEARELRQPTTRMLTEVTPMPMLMGLMPALDLDADNTARERLDSTTFGRVLVVDDDLATRNLLVKLLQPAGFITITATNGGEAVRQLKAAQPDLVIIDVMLPQIDGFQICRAIKQSRNYQHIAVILMSAMLDSGRRVSEEVVHSYGADGYFEKPLDTGRLLERIRAILHPRAVGTPAPQPIHDGQQRASARDDGSFQRALSLYRAGDLDSAIEVLRSGLQADPLSAKHHFVLANLLQKKSLFYEAIDEYETTVNIKPDYFPALTRLAYLYYKKGFSAKAVDTWRRALPYCRDVALRKNIEAFIRKLIDNMQTQSDR